MDTVTQSQQKVHCELLTDSGQNVEGDSGQINTEPTDGTVCGTETLGRL